VSDLIDACAAAWTAIRVARREAVSFPDPPERDAFGLPIAIWA
jgi:predicted RNase H-like nuclease